MKFLFIVNVKNLFLIEWSCRSHPIMLTIATLVINNYCPCGPTSCKTHVFWVSVLRSTTMYAPMKYRCMFKMSSRILSNSGRHSSSKCFARTKRNDHVAQHLLRHMSFGCLFLDPQLCMHQWNTGVCLRWVAELWASGHWHYERTL